MQNLQPLILDPSIPDNIPEKRNPTPAVGFEGVIEFEVLDDFKQVAHFFYKNGIFKNLLHDTCNEEDYMVYLSNHKNLYQISVGKEFAGIITIDDLGKVMDQSICEIHVLVLPYMRRYSLDIMRNFSKLIFEVTNFKHIATTVPDHCEKITLVLGRIGFKYVTTKDSGYKRYSKPIQLHYMFKSKIGD